MKSIRRGQRLITVMLLLFLVAMGALIYKLQKEAKFYMSYARNVSLGYVYDRNGDVLFDQNASKDSYDADHFLDVGNFIGDDSGQMTNTLVAQNLDVLTNFSFMLGEHKDGDAAIHTTLDHAVNQKVYDAFGSLDGCAVAYNYKTGEIYVCLSKPSINILNNYEDIASLKEGSMMCKVFYKTVPGSTQKISTTIAALETMGYEKLMQKRFGCEGLYLNQSWQNIKCHEEAGHGMQDIYQAFAHSCNPYFAQLVEDPDLPLDSVIGVYEKMGYAVNIESSAERAIDINGITARSASTTLIDETDFDTQWGCMGQGATLVSPLQLMLWQSAIANASGSVTEAYLIDHVTSVNGRVTSSASTSYGEQMFSEDTASIMRGIMVRNGSSNYSELLPGTDVAVKSGTAQVGDGDQENSLLVGFTDDEDFPVAFCVVVEDFRGSGTEARDIAAVLLQELEESLG